MNHLKNKTLLPSVTQNEPNLSVLNPATGEVLTSLKIDSITAVDDKINKAQIAQKQWAKKSVDARSQIMMNWYDLIMENQADLARIITLEQGKPLAESQGEVRYGASFIEWFAQEIKRLYGQTIPTDDGRQLTTIYQPIGVVSAITPWNFPLAMMTRKVAPALASGCACVLKPAEATPLSALALGQLAYQAGIPHDLLPIIITQDPKAVGEVLTHSPIIKKLSFTGSTVTGRLLMKQCSHTIKRTSMELGGNAPFIIFEDADLEKAVQGAIASKFRNSGQTCVCANRFYVHKSVHDEFVRKFDEAVSELKMGDGLDKETKITALINQKALDKAQKILENTLKSGAKPTRAIKAVNGLLMPPVILTGVQHEMDITQTEIFAPIAPIIQFEDENEVIEMANDTIYGLAAYFYTEDRKRINRVMKGLESGMVGVNEGIISSQIAPFGGVKQSGIGREGGAQGLLEYVNVKYICMGDSE